MDLISGFGDIVVSGTVFYVLVAVGGFILGWVNHGRTVEKRLKKEIADLEKRVDRSEWDWNDLKRLHPELVKGFPPRD